MALDAARRHCPADALDAQRPRLPAARLAAVDRCECADSGCKAAPWHQGDGVCGRAGEMHLFRIDMGQSDEPLVFCEPCGDDALDSGVFVAGSDLPCSEAEERQIDALLYDILAP